MRHKTFDHSPRLSLNGYGEERERVPVSLPKMIWLEAAAEGDAKEAATRFAEYRAIRAGREAWQAINRAESFDGWRTIGAALAVGKAHALRVTGANAAWGRNYSRAFSEWMKQQGFDKIAKSVRSVAIELHENAAAIEAWRATLPERQRKRLLHPLSNVRRWRAATQSNGKAPADLKREAMAAWRKFMSCVRALPADQAWRGGTRSLTKRPRVVDSP
jgi:hypothetical protein